MLRSLAAVALVVVFCTTGMAQVKVRGYTRKDGTNVAPHRRSNPDATFGNNWSTVGNVNPNTGQPGTQQTPPVGYGSQLAALAAAAYQGVPNYRMPACSQSRGMLPNASLSPYYPQDSYSHSLSGPTDAELRTAAAQQ